MTPALHFRRQLDAPPVAAEAPGVTVRTFDMPADIAPWLLLRDRAMSDQFPPIRSWTDRDFAREMSSKPWWHTSRTWLAIAGELRSPDAPEKPPLIGSVTQALREGKHSTIPVVHWLLVDPAWRRRGVARHLMSHLERAAWDAGWREIELETHAGWASAVAFYQSIGYAPARRDSPR